MLHADNRMDAGIYAIVHLATGRRYVGSTGNLRSRLRSHRRELSRGVHRNRHLQGAWSKYGEAAFVSMVVERVADPALLRGREQAWLDAAQPLVYNCGKHAERPTLGVKRGTFTDDHREKLSAAKRGRSRPHTPEQRASIVAANKRRAGSSHTPETREKLRALNVGRKRAPFSPETIERMRIAALNRAKPSAADRLKMSEAAKRRGNCTPFEARSAALKGIRRSPEHLARLHAGRDAAHARRKGQAVTDAVSV